MAAVKNEVKVVEEKVVVEKVTNVIDVFWNGFLNVSVKLSPHGLAFFYMR